MKFDKVGDKVQGYIRDVFYRPAEGVYKPTRGITLETPDGKLVNVAIKRHDFVLEKTDKLRLGDPLTVIFEEELKAKGPGLNPTKVLGFYGKNLPENEGNKTVLELDLEDMNKPSTRVEGGGEEGEDKDFEGAGK